MSALWEKPCPFCPIISGDSPVDFVDEGPGHVAFVPIGPHVDGHVLFVPRAHLPDATVNAEVAGQVFAAASRYVQTRGVDANILTSIGEAATQSVPHLHIHVIPRGPQDGLNSRWPWL